MNAKQLQKIARKGLVIATAHGNVDASETATVWGEGANVKGFAMTRKPATHTVAQANALHPQFGDKAAVWAEGQH